MNFSEIWERPQRTEPNLRKAIVYLDTIGQYSVMGGKLTTRRLINLAKLRVENADLYRRIAQSSRLKAKQACISECLARIAANIVTINGIRQAVANGNLRLVVYICKKCKMHHLPNAEDTISAGNRALLRAIDTFDSTYKIQFSTFAYRVILNEMRNCGSSGGLISRGVGNRIHLVQKAIQTIINAAGSAGYEPTAVEIVDELNRTGPVSNRGKWKIKEVLRLIDSAKHYCVRNVEAIDTMQCSMDAEFDDSMGDILEVIKTWKERDQQVILARFGLNGTKPKTLKDIGEELGVTRERVRQIELRCINDLKKALVGRNSHIKAQSV